MIPRPWRRDSHPAPDLLRVVEEDVLPEEVVREVRSHLESCTICAQLHRDLLHPSLSEPSLQELTGLGKRVLPRIAPRRSLGRYAAAATAIAAMFATAVWLRNPGASALPRHAETAQPAPQPRLYLQPASLRLPLATALILRGQQDDRSEQYLKELGGALEPYRAGQYAEATVRLKALAARYPRSVEPPFYLGVTRLLAGDAPGAIEPLRQARGIGGEALNDDIQWYLAIGYERTGSWAQALPLLQALCGGAGPYREEACEASR